ncbi:hypothetical protein OG689_35075 [Kitasatospora sp. NBC_00240]|uniref:hypothetical protein n=1 Tax=Kitasatospora sp. NBC_00240 TaxID=2903567 RepID=UPI0022541E3A|nr:hypothetical protein [Kitasatospora sp. NBC_00240]MCX5214424.1 hypothetical protein [Kitasatospora sp. NBC_00240]
MPKKRSRAAGPAVADQPVPEREGESEGEQWTNMELHSPVRYKGFTDAEGVRWALARGPLDPRRAKRLAVTADLMWMGCDVGHDWDRYTYVPEYVPTAERPARWLEIRKRLNVRDWDPLHGRAFLAYEFVSNGRVLLYIDVYC